MYKKILLSLFFVLFFCFQSHASMSKEEIMVEDFESGELSGWSKRTNAEIENTDEDVHSGKRSLKVKVDFSEITYGWFLKSFDERMDLTSFNALKLWAKGDGSGNGFQAIIRIMDGNKEIKYSSGASLSFKGWRELIFPFVNFSPQIPEDHLSSVQGLMFNLTKSAKSEGVAYVDDIRICTIKQVESRAVKQRQEKKITKIEIPGIPDEHPRLLFTRKEVNSILEKVNRQKWAKSIYDGIIAGANKWRNWQVDIPDKEGGWWHWYICRKCGAWLKPVNPTEHKCPACGEIHTGEPYDSVYAYMRHNEIINAAKTLGIAYVFTGDETYARKAKEILLGYAEKYEGYKEHDIHGKPSSSGGKMLSQSLDESVWLIPAVQAYDLVYNICNEKERKQIEDRLIRLAVEIPHRRNTGISNFQSWHNAAMIGSALVMKDEKLLDEVINGPGSFFYQMENSLGDDGMWWEGSWGYHFYALSAIVHLTEMAYHCGIDLYKNNRRLKSLFDAPILFMTPHQALPAVHDSGGGGEMTFGGELYEIAYARWKDEKYVPVILKGRNNLNALLYGEEEIIKPKKDTTPSFDFKDVGFIILRSTGRNKNYVLMDYGPHGGGHGHLDKLNIVFASLGRTFAPDLGSIGYGSPLMGSWYRPTISHNTILVDGTSQAECSGGLLEFYSGPFLQIATAFCDAAYYGVKMQRTLILSDDYLIIADNLKSDENHTYDWVYHNYGKIASSLPFKEQDNLAGHGYQHIKNPKSLVSKGDTTLLWEVDSSKRLKMWITGGENTEIIVGEGIGNPASLVVPMALLRREAKETTYIVVLEPFKKEREGIISVKKDSKNLEIVLRDRKDVYSWKDAGFTVLDTESIKKVESVLEKLQQETPAEPVDFPVALIVSGDTRTKSKVELLIEAEDITGQGEGEIKVREDKIGAKKSFSHWDQSEHWLEWKFSIPEEGFYTITLRYCTAGSPARSLVIDNQYPAEHFKKVVFQSTQGDSPSDGWSNNKDDWKSHTFSDSDGKTPFRFYFKPGEHRIKMVNLEGGGVNLDYIVIKNL